MTAGDIITGMYAVPTAFIPAASVEIMITAWGQNNNTNVNVSDGVNSFYFARSSDSLAAQTQGNAKIGITNTFYFDMKGSSVNAFTGIQIK